MDAKGALGLLRSVVLSTCRLAVCDDSWCSGGPMFSREGTLRVSCWAMREVELSTARCVQVTLMKGVGAAFSICPSPKQTRKPLARNEHTLAHVQPPLQAASPCARSRWPGSCTMCSSSRTSWYSPNCNNEAVVAFSWRSAHQQKRSNTHVPEAGCHERQPSPHATQRKSHACRTRC